MMPFAHLVQEHRRILQLHYEIIELVGQKPIAANLAAVRQELGSAARAYLARKEIEVLMPLRASPDPAHRELAKKSTEQEFQVRQSTMAHYQRWTPQAIEADPREFRMVVRGLARALERRIAHEEKVIHPAAMLASIRVEAA